MKNRKSLVGLIAAIALFAPVLAFADVWPTEFNALRVSGSMSMPETEDWCAGGSYFIVSAQGKKPGTPQGQGFVELTIPLVAEGFGVSEDRVRFQEDSEFSILPFNADQSADQTRNGKTYRENFAICTKTAEEIEAEGAEKERVARDEVIVIRQGLTIETAQLIALLMEEIRFLEEQIEWIKSGYTVPMKETKPTDKKEPENTPEGENRLDRKILDPSTPAGTIEDIAR